MAKPARLPMLNFGPEVLVCWQAMLIKKLGQAPGPRFFSGVGGSRLGCVDPGSCHASSVERRIIVIMLNVFRAFEPCHPPHVVGRGPQVEWRGWLGVQVRSREGPASRASIVGYLVTTAVFTPTATPRPSSSAVRAGRRRRLLALPAAARQARPPSGVPPFHGAGD